MRVGHWWSDSMYVRRGGMIMCARYWWSEESHAKMEVGKAGKTGTT